MRLIISLVVCLTLLTLCHLTVEAFRFPCRSIYHKVHHRHPPIPHFASSSSSSSNANQERFITFINDIKEVLSTPGLSGAGIIRSFQVARGLGKVVHDFSQNQASFQDDKGQFSIPKALRRLFEALGATYIKLGQFIASSPTIFPAEYVEEFQSCLDTTPTVSFQEIKKIIEDDLKRPISSLYSSIDPQPLASASIAQVHRAKLKDGREVVVKVRKPGVDSTLKADLAFLLIASKVIELVNPSVSSLSLANIVDDIRHSMLDELDFRKEVQNLLNFRQFLERNNIVEAVAPCPYLQFSGERVLTMDYLKGSPLVDLEQLRKVTSNPETVLVSALRTWAMTVATNDLFHADVHAGNLLVLEDGRIGFIDFGIVGKISNTFRDAIGDLFNAFVEEDYEKMAKALVQMGATKSGVDYAKFGRELEEIVKRIGSLEPQVVIRTDVQGDTLDAQLAVDEKETTRIVLEIVGVAERNGLQLPREFGLVLKQALYFDRYQKLLAPDVDPLRDSRVRGRLADLVNTSNRNTVIDAEIVEE
eukprot:gene5279-5815_t